MSHYLFAYGFLKRQFHGSEKTQTPDMNVTFVSEGYLPGRLYQVDVFPGVIYDPDEFVKKVKGEIFQMIKPEEQLQVLDKYENALPLVHLNPDYERRLRMIETPDGPLECWVYEYLKPVNPANEIESGSFL